MKWKKYEIVIEYKKEGSCSSLKEVKFPKNVPGFVAESIANKLLEGRTIKRIETKL